MMSNESGLEHAPEEIKLAVDLIFLLESNEVDPKIALQALEIVKGDLLKKIEG
nr:pleiotropic regulatory protein RsmS [Vibrio hangzhouensis]